MDETLRALEEDLISVLDGSVGVVEWVWRVYIYREGKSLQIAIGNGIWMGEKYSGGRIF